ncbi:hypothetical protein [Sphingomonas bacterium]|uniref:hypothetical protein n=1 Tax=Sphingomonas bacterium TaxID=1895847 RepID=UPI0020C705F6|nr:hypothetical protein [Sphingomonas bacterium]
MAGRAMSQCCDVGEGRNVQISNDPDGDQRSVIRVGQDRAGHWLAQESGGRLEGRFVSFDAALHFARAERHGFPGAAVVVVRDPIVPFVSFDPVGPDERALARAA